MTDSNQLFNEIVSELTKPGEIFETREIQDVNGNSFSEYVTFPDNLPVVPAWRICKLKTTKNRVNDLNLKFISSKIFFLY